MPGRRVQEPTEEGALLAVRFAQHMFEFQQKHIDLMKAVWNRDVPQEAFELMSRELYELANALKAEKIELQRRKDVLPPDGSEQA